MPNTVYADHKKDFSIVYKIFQVTEKGLVEPKESINDYGRYYDSDIFEEYESEKEALDALFLSDKIEPYSLSQFIVMPVYKISPVY